MNSYQKQTAEYWGMEVCGIVSCSDFRAFADSSIAVVCIERFIYTTAISVISGSNRLTRFCYATAADARRALDDWEATGYCGKPKNYIKQKPEDDLCPV
jgi:hypothetical protein